MEGGFECNCKTGYEGKYCEIDSDDCASNPCQGEGSFCYDLGIFEVTLYPFEYFLFQLTTMSANVRVDWEESLAKKISTTVNPIPASMVYAWIRLEDTNVIVIKDTLELIVHR